MFLKELDRISTKISTMGTFRVSLTPLGTLFANHIHPGPENSASTILFRLGVDRE